MSCLGSAPNKREGQEFMSTTCSFKGYAKLIPGLFSSLLTLLIFLWFISADALAQTDTFIAHSGLWSEDENWSLDAVPTRNNNCVIPATSVVTSDLAGECANFTLGPGGSLTVTPGYLFIYKSSFTNYGTISVGPGNGLAFVQPSVTTTISGGGTITLTTSNASFTGSGNTVINADNTIQGQGYMGVTQFTNKSLINANVPSAVLQLHAAGTIGISNTGTIQASSGGILALTPQSLGVPFNNAGGTIQALNGSTVQLQGYTITGGTLISSRTGVFQGVNTLVLNNLTNNANYEVTTNSDTALQGTITNGGTVTVQQGELLVSGSATLKGAGTVIGKAPLLLGSYTIPATLLNQSTIEGGGTIGDSYLTVTNQGTINANNASNPMIIVGPNALTNTATIEASGGATLEIRNTVNNTGATIEAQAGSKVLLNTGTVNGGTLSTSGAGVIQSENGTLDGSVNVVTNQGMLLTASGFNLNLKGTINNNGTIALSKTGGCAALNAPTTLTGSGKVTMTSSNCFFGYATTDTLNNQSTIEGAGSIGDSNPMGITNNGIIFANSTKPLTITPDATLGFTNNGKLMVNRGSLLNILGLFNNVSGTTLSGGTYVVTGTLELQGAIATNDANITLTGPTAQFLNSFTNTNALAGLAANSASGSLLVQSGQVLTTATNLGNAGKVIVGTSSGLSVGRSYTQTAGTTTVDGTLTALMGLILENGSLLGKGTLTGAVTADASVTAGDSTTKPGKLTMTGSYTQNSTGILNISIGGSTAGKYGQVVVSNGVRLGGTLDIKRINGFVPEVGDTFSIVTGSAVTGQFATVNGLNINTGEHFEIAYTATAVKLTVVSGS